MRRSLAAALLALVTPGVALAAEGGPSQQEVEAWLDARAVTSGRTLGAPDTVEEAPPPPPHHRGLVVEGNVGVLGHVGPMKHVSPTAPWFHALVGYEVFDFAMLLVEGDVAFTDTSYANPPPQPRTYALWGLGGGVRFTVRPFDRFGMFVQGSIGAARVTEDVLGIYGYQSADEVNPFFGATAGLEWYQVSPHLALALHGGVRNYADTFDRVSSSETPLAWLGSIAIRYAF